MCLLALSRNKQVSMQIFRRLMVSIALATSLLGLSVSSSYASTKGPEGLADGPGIWVNMWNYPQGDVKAYCESLHAKGIRNIFLQTSRSNTEAICHPEQLGALIDASHFYKIRVIAWSFAELTNPASDADKLIAAARFLSPTGQHLDALAANMEKNLDQVKVEVYSKRMREAVGANFPMVAVVYSPLNGAPQVAHIPWKTLDHYYDVIAPMNYWNSKYKKLDAYEYTVSTVHRVRELVGRPDVEIHVIGDGMGTHSDTIVPFFKACQDAEVTSASIYPNYKMTAEQMDCASQYSNYFPVNSRFRLAAFKQLRKQGSLKGPENNDPSSAISRGEFYSLLVHQLYPNKFGQDLTGAQAMPILSKAGAGNYIAQSNEGGDLEAVLRSPITSSEALQVVAKLIDKNGELAAPGEIKVATAAPGVKKRNRSGAWLVQPAYAAEGKTAQSTRAVNYLDAAQIVLQASSALR
jgi:hypothetical protein